MAEIKTTEDEQLPEEPELSKRREDPASHLLRYTAADLEETEFLWHPYLIADEFCTLAGPKGVGKTWVAIDIATRVAMGRGFPGDETEREPRTVIYGTREGKPTRGILRRFLDLGVDPRRIGFLPRDWDLGKLADLEAKILLDKSKLVILDPLQSFFPGASAYSGPPARRITEALSDLAGEIGCCIIGILHLTKDHKHPRGSGEIENVARVNLQMGKCGDGRGLLVQTKNNEARSAVSRRYAIREDGRGVDWQDEAPDEGVEELLARKKSSAGPRELATVYLRTALQDGPRPARQLQERAGQQGLNIKTLRRAATAMGISQEAGTIFQSGREWLWKLPGSPAESVSTCPPEPARRQMDTWTDEAPQDDHDDPDKDEMIVLSMAANKIED